MKQENATQKKSGKLMGAASITLTVLMIGPMLQNGVLLRF